MNPVILPDNILKRMSAADRKLMGKAGITADEAALKCVARSERDLQRIVIAWLRHRGYTVIVSAMHMATSNNVGTPDLLLAVKGRALAIECKMPGCSPTEDQLKMMQAMRLDGWVTIVIQHLEQVVSVIRDLEGTK